MNYVMKMMLGVALGAVAAYLLVTKLFMPQEG